MGSRIASTHRRLRQCLPDPSGAGPGRTAVSSASTARCSTSEPRPTLYGSNGSRTEALAKWLDIYNRRRPTPRSEATAGLAAFNNVIWNDNYASGTSTVGGVGKTMFAPWFSHST
jgi:hypothetical protein